MEEEYELDDDFDLEDNEDEFLDDDEIVIPEDVQDEDVDENYIYEQLSKRKNSRARERYIDNSFTRDIVVNESGGDYGVTNPYSSAAGKYQFLWNTWGNKITKHTGVRSKEEFLNNPEAQDSFYNDYYLPKELMPAVDRIKRKLSPNLSINQLAKLVHFRGEKGAMDYIRGDVGDKPESYNMPTSKYIGRQLGGLTNGELSFPDVDLAGIYNTAKSVARNVVGNISQGIDMAEQFTSQQNNNAQYRRMLQQLYGDNPSNYAPVTQRINNNPVLQ